MSFTEELGFTRSQLLSLTYDELVDLFFDRDLTKEELDCLGEDFDIIMLPSYMTSRVEKRSYLAREIADMGVRQRRQLTSVDRTG